MVQTADRPRIKANKPPRSVKSQQRPAQYADNVELNKLQIENEEKLIEQLLEFTNQMESRMKVLAHKEDNDNPADLDADDHPELKEMMAKLGSKSKKIKGLQYAISEMYQRLESSYKIDRIVEMENKLVDCDRIYNEQLNAISDLQKAKSEQKVRIQI